MSNEIKSSENNMLSISIVKGKEYRTHIDDIYDKNSFFHSVYARSAYLIEEIVTRNVSKSNSAACEKDDDEDIICSNNLIMYCGDRGRGKSSAMSSFAKELQKFCQNRSNTFHQATDGSIWGKNTQNSVFSVIKLIDPTIIAEKEPFMRVLLSKMFADLREYWKGKPDVGSRDYYGSDYIDKNRKLQKDTIVKFKKCYSVLDMIYRDDQRWVTTDDLDEMISLGDSSDLKRDFKMLVDHYLDQIHGSGNFPKYLVLQIDDVDLNAKKAYQMIEDIRKYCIVPNVIVLMAVNLPQMQKVVEQHFIKDYQLLIEVYQKEMKKDRYLGVKDCRHMASRYIDKVMPEGHRIHLPDICSYLRRDSSGLLVKYFQQSYEGVNANEDVLVYQTMDGQTIFDYQERLTRLIYEKTGIILEKPDTYVHAFLPKSMRELTHFLAYICDLEDCCIQLYNDQNKTFDVGLMHLNALYNGEVKNEQFYRNETKKHFLNKEDAEKELVKRKQNIHALLNYLTKDWSVANLTVAYQHIVQELDKAIPNEKIRTAVWALETLRISDDEKKRVHDYSFAYLNYLWGTLVHQEPLPNGRTNISRLISAIRLYFVLFFEERLIDRILNADHNKLQADSDKKGNRLNLSWLFLNGDIWRLNCDGEDGPSGLNDNTLRLDAGGFYRDRKYGEKEYLHQCGASNAKNEEERKKYKIFRFKNYFDEQEPRAIYVLEDDLSEELMYKLSLQNLLLMLYTNGELQKHIGHYFKYHRCETLWNVANIPNKVDAFLHDIQMALNELTYIPIKWKLPETVQSPCVSACEKK